MTTTIRSAGGPALAAEIDAPEEPVGAVVLCHPHPQMGGTMNAPLLLAIRDRLVAEGWAVLRFNFRGIGGSEGVSSTGIEEVDDARGALARAREEFPGAPVAIAGWSFGAAVALRTTMVEPDVAACVAIAPAIDEKPGITAGCPPPEQIPPSIPVLIVCAARDELVEPADCVRWGEASGARVVAMKGANHFFWAKYDDLANEIVGFLQTAVGKG